MTSGQVLCLPLYAMLEAAEQERIIDILLACANGTIV
jgi:hypothetical protein